MKIFFNTLALTCFTILFTTGVVFAQERGNDKNRVSPNASVSQTIGTTVVSITYGRPSLKGRAYFAEKSELAPLGNWWRTGANESTVITFSKDVSVQGKDIKAGTYSLYTIPGKKEWTIILNSKLSWGTEFDESQNVLEVKAPVGNGVPMEQFLIYFENVTATTADVVLHWGTTKVPFTVAAK